MSLVGLFVVIVLLLVIMPALLYLMGWGIARTIRKDSGWIGSPPPRQELRDKSTGEPPSRVKA
jgi:hypothetical protein